jgi:hypothetical protein
VLALVVPWIALVFNRWAAAAVAGVLTLTATILYSISTRHIPSNVNMRVDVAIMYPLLLGHCPRRQISFLWVRVAIEDDRTDRGTLR